MDQREVVIEHRIVTGQAGEQHFTLFQPLEGETFTTSPEARGGGCVCAVVVVCVWGEVVMVCVCVCEVVMVCVGGVRW